MDVAHVDRQAEAQAQVPGFQVLHHAPLVMTADAVLSREEAAELIALAKHRLQRAKVSFDAEYGITDGRSGQNCWLSYADYPLARRIGERIAALVGMPLANAEALQVLHYGPEQEYRAHYDAYDLSTARGQRCCRYGGQRLLTALVYLNDVTEGGGTGFPRLKLEVQPAPGRMVLFQNTGDDNTRPHPDSLHAGMPVLKGEKWAFNIWFHARPMSEVQNFEPSPDMLPVASAEAGAQKHWQVRANRAQRIVEAAAEQVTELATGQPQPVCFTHWDTFGGSTCPQGGLAANARLLQLVDRKISNPLAHKGRLPQLLEAQGLSELVPITLDSVAAARAVDLPANAVWFVKPVFGTAGKGMQCIQHAQLETFELPAHYVLQQSVADLQLKNGRKFTTRIYLLLTDSRVFLYRNGFTITHAKPYQPDSTDYAVQIEHAGYTDAGSAITMTPGSRDTEFQAAFGVLESFARQLVPLLRECTQACGRDQYLLLGVDVLLTAEPGVKLIEINTMPNFIHTNEINREVNVPFFTAVMRTLLHDWDERLLEIT